MFSAENSICPRRFIRDGPELLHTCSTCMSIARPYLRGVLFIFTECIWSYVVLLRIRAYPLEEECRIINQSGSCTLWPLRLLYCCFPLNRRQISSDITSSPLLATTTKTLTSKGLAWRLNKSACNSGNVITPPENSCESRAPLGHPRSRSGATFNPQSNPSLSPAHNGCRAQLGERGAWRGTLPGTGLLGPRGGGES